MTYPLSVRMPDIEGDMTLKAIATPSDGPAKDMTTSRRFFKLVAKGAIPVPQRRSTPAQSAESGGQFSPDK